jgi:septal ring factor EnvC (AmiA/AmiB activator)
LPPFSVLGQTREDVIEHMRQEIATLRRTSAEAVSTSIRLTEQLANANLEVSRSREAVRDLEDMLQDEANKRKDAERMKELEMERRRAAEHALGTLTLRSPNRTSRPT